MGLARLRQSLTGQYRDDVSWTTLTEMDGVLGTPDFISPEQARNPRNVDIRADLYSLGCTFYFILTGQLPFPGGTGVEKMLKHQLDRPRDIGELRSGLPTSVVNVVQRLMAKKPDDRYQTPQELANTLAVFLAPPTGAASSSNDGPPQVRASAENATANAIEQNIEPTANTPATLADDEFIPIDEILSASSHSAAKRPKESDSAHAAPASESSTIRPGAQVRGHNAVVSAIAVTTDGRLAATGDVDGKLRVWDLTTPQPIEVAHLERPTEIQAIAFAPQYSDFLVFGEVVQTNAALRRWEWGTNRLSELNVLEAIKQFGIGCLSYAPDGGTLAAGIGAQVVVAKVANRDIVQWRNFKCQGQPVQALAISPEHRLLATSNHGASIHCWDLNKGRWRANSGVDIRTNAAIIATMAFSPDGHWLAMGALDGRVILWDLGGESESSIELAGHSSSLLRVQFTSDGKTLVSISTNGEVIFWDWNAARAQRDLRINLNLVYRVALSTNAMRLVAGYSNGNIAIWNLASAPEASGRSGVLRSQASVA
jgi:hypothetical protein